MMTNTPTTTAPGAARLTAATSLFAILAGGLLLLGWACGVPRLIGWELPWTIIKANVALGWVLLGVALWCLRVPVPSAAARGTAYVCAGITAVLGLLTLVEFLTGRSFGIDSLVNVLTPGVTTIPFVQRTRPTAVMNFLCLGLALLLLEVEIRHRRPAQYLTLLAFLSMFTALLGHIYDAQEFADFAPSDLVAFIKTLPFIGLGVGVFCARPRAGLMTLITGEGPGSLLVRRLLPAAVVTTIMIGWLVLSGKEWHQFDLPLGMAVAVLCILLIFTGLILRMAELLQRTELARQQGAREREQLLEETQRRAAELESFFSSAGDGLLMLDTAGNVVRINQAMRAMMGYHEDVVHLSFAERIAWARVEMPDGRLITWEETPTCHALRGEAMQGFIVQLHPPGRQLWVSISAAPIRTVDGRILGAVQIFTDITAQQALQERQQAFTHCVSHDLRTPLIIIQWHAQLLAQLLGQDAPAEMRERVETIQRGTRLMQGMLEDLIDLARVENGRMHLDLQHLYPHSFLAGLLQRSAGVLETSRIQLDIPAELPPVSADLNRLERIVLNLLSNALTYTPADSPVLVRAFPGDDALHLTVIDHGPGITAAEATHIFDRFYRAQHQRHGEGMGLGLYITKLLVEAHGGRIWFTPTPEHGATFTFTLPFNREDDRS